MTTTVQLQDTLTNLDALYVSYNALLQDAKAQLETLDFALSDTDSDTIVQKLRTRNDFKKSVAEYLLMSLTDMIKSDSDAFEDSAIYKKLLSTITTKVEEHMTEQFYDMLNTQVKSFLESPELASKVEQAALKTPVVMQAAQTRLTLRKLNELLTDDSQQRTTE